MDSEKVTGGFDAFHLKVVAIVAMFLNHLGSGLAIDKYSEALFFFTEFIGKLTFPIMAYLLVEGFRYTRNKVKYGSRLALFSVISAYPFQQLFYASGSFSPIQLVNNIFFTLLMGLILISICEKVNHGVLQGLLVILFSGLTMFSDWPLIGVLLIYGFYRIKDAKKRVIIPVLYTLAFLVFIMLSGYFYMPEAVPLYTIFTGFGLLLVIPLLLNYNGQRGYSPQWVKWGFYLFYPVHLMLLVFIRNFLG
ncbi:hypothetical protein M2139_000265 [Enterococcus sp. PF1-24]|uniref:TraX family protein n=1 Tax=unclassified Enterococcus TaxID=2608891 RepID=UPI002473D962|nr:MULTISPECIES: TraX family protein [unclassified Enterococcus]MDH6363315.1 hypothetical protein [Enterococcus sp. PFB1-1]MDH6400384.1 hypothetical protein [Enterococcus sp. PF1-24]